MNLSDQQLSEPSLSLLQKKLNFCPTPEPDHISKHLTDLLIFERRCRLRLHFLLLNNDEEKEDEYRVSSAWTPVSGCSTGLDAFLNNVTSQVLDVAAQKTRHNLSRDEHLALVELKNNNSIEIKPADKGGALVIMNRSDYKAECMRQLCNWEHYI